MPIVLERTIGKQSNLIFSNKVVVDEDLLRIETNFSNTISDMADWHQKMRSPFKFWRPTTVANELEVRNQDYVQFVQELLDCNDTISGSVFDFIVQANLQVANPSSKKIKLKESTHILYENFEEVMSKLKNYYPSNTEPSLQDIVSDCNERLSKKTARDR